MLLLRPTMLEDISRRPVRKRSENRFNENLKTEIQIKTQTTEAPIEYGLVAAMAFSKRCVKLPISSRLPNSTKKVKYN